MVDILVKPSEKDTNQVNQAMSLDQSSTMNKTVMFANINQSNLQTSENMSDDEYLPSSYQYC